MLTGVISSACRVVAISSAAQAAQYSAALIVAAEMECNAAWVEVVRRAAALAEATVVPAVAVTVADVTN